MNSLRTLTIKARRRYIMDSELLRIKVGICYGKDGKRAPSGPMIFCLVMTYITGQRASDLLSMGWSEIGQDAASCSSRAKRWYRPESRF